MNKISCPLLKAVGLLLLAPTVAFSAPAPDGNSVLILGTTVSGGLSSLEATQVVAQGKTPVVVDAVTWGGMTTAEFASYRAIVLGDPNCAVGTSP
ncbi:MAG: hypothetical protein RLZZ230_538, partial [Candidatus Parcubacteria bacterium]